MNWINLRTETLRAPEYIGSEPMARATWFNVLAYCCEQENGGRIVGAKSWKDRQWQQTCGVTLAEIEESAPLLGWDGNDLVIWRYPSEKEAEVQAKREGGKRGGKASGEARREASGEAELEAELERKGREGKGMEGERNGSSASPTPDPPKTVVMPTLDQAKAFAPSAGIDPKAAECWWLECDSRPLAPDGAFTDRDGRAIHRWQSHLTSYGRKWQANDARHEARVNGEKPKKPMSL